MNKSISTIFGNANINSEGYYAITTYKEGNRGKKLHRLIFERFWKIKIPKGVIIHHKDGNKLNNCILNLEPIKHSKHTTLHWTGKKHSEETKQKMSNSHNGKILSKEHKLTLSKSHKNSTGIFRVAIKKDKSTKQGFIYIYQVYKGNTRIKLSSVNIHKLKSKVIEKGYDWIILDEEKAKLILGEKQ